ncbi:MAG: DEAD/DEAH box helicase [Hyphomonadaceae bacterium]|nr:DEAD/DEAH box helicase [Hyphomonadaceae bacterium]
MSFPPSHPALDRALAARGYVEPTSVQLAVVEADKDGVDMLVSAQTGSGKTVAFGLALASSLLGEAERFDKPGNPQALIIAPTRELAMQISRELAWLYAETGARIVQCVGGMSVRDEQRQLSVGAHIVIGTPGRLCDHLTKGYLDLSTLKVAVLDEADEMLDLGFREELETLLDATSAETRRTLLFSATIARGIAMLAKNYQRDAVRIDTTSQTEPHGDIDYRAMRISPGDTERAVVNVLRYFEAGGALVFCATREAVRHLHASLRERGFHVVGLSGEMNQRERNDALQSLRDGHAKVCVATDVAARGLDLPDLGLVIHADLPTNKATLLHRSGRTGRAGRKGTSVLLVTHTKRRRTEQVLQSANIEATWSGPPTAAEIRTQDHQRLLEHPALKAEASVDDLELAKQIAEKLPPEQIAAALIGLLRAELPDPEDVSDDARMRDTQASVPRERAPPRSREERGFVASEGDGVWFRLNVGRRRNADPKWLVPLICRLGHITKAEIGPIRVFDEETKFEIVGHAADAFRVAAEATLEDNIQITATAAPQRGEFTPRGPRPPREARDVRPPRESREPREHHEPREQREPRAPREHQADAPRPAAHRPPREDRRPSPRDAERDQRAKARAHIEADPVLASLKTSERSTPGVDTSSGMNRRQRRDAARAAGALPVIAPRGEEPVKRQWAPDDKGAAADAPRPPRQDRSVGDRRERPAPGKPGNFKPRGFKPRGPKPSGGKPYRGKSGGGGNSKGNWRAK